ncbi:hypothetical protein [Clostridium akagii]|uniref:hypothetical protein n=1 Tax=Clostridium akagii TaxID=91623 RepID=UPI00047D3CB2|nr:hypothetical protein [Clostridium akagii]
MSKKDDTPNIKNIDDGILESLNGFKKQHANNSLMQLTYIEGLISKLNIIRENMLNMVTQSESLLEKCHPSYLASAKNLLYYMALRSHDIQSL